MISNQMPSLPSLLAKSQRDPARAHGDESLRGHTACVLRAASTLLDLRGESSLQALGLPLELLPRLKRIVRLSAFAHDLGKCSEQFQLLVRHKLTERQLLRHEALSLWLCWPGQTLSSWLRPAVETDMEYLLAILSAAGHHRKFPLNACSAIDGTKTKAKLLTGHPDFASTLALGAKMLGLSTPPLLGDEEVLVSPFRNPRGIPASWQEEAEDFIPPRSPDARLLAVAKALVLDADVAGSALPRYGERFTWIEARLRDRADQDTLSAVVSQRLSGRAPRPFQASVAASAAPITLVRAGCGSGKTAAAYLWAAQQHLGRQLWVTYPTTGTATEGFRDYLVGIDGLNARLEHSRASVDIEIFELASEDEQSGPRARDRLAALRSWGQSVVTCTVDTVLGLVQNHRQGLYAFPGLTHSALVFDEIHAYDESLFGALLRFLEDLPGLPALLMTASLPASRLEALRTLTRRVHQRPLIEIHGPPDLETLPRYQQAAAGDTDPLVRVRDCLLRGGKEGRPGKVLWVCNTVKRCLEMAERAAEFMPLLYHSRFCYRDRVARHGAVVDAFAAPGPAFAITTQVCEMSLDLSADLLLTDLAPIPALIQRMGRLNRRSSPSEPLGTRPFVVLPFAGLPYDDSQLTEAKEWLGQLGMDALSQSDLIAAWHAQEQDAPQVPVGLSAWLDGRYVTEPATLRESSPGLTVLLEEHRDLVQRGLASALEWALPMNAPRAELNWKSWPMTEHYPVPPRDLIHYDPMRGARWASLPKR